MGLPDGKVALVTGAGRGQGRSHARGLAQEGADVIAVDASESLDWMTYDLASAADLDETGRLVEELDRRAVVRRADIRDLDALAAAVTGSPSSDGSTSSATGAISAWSPGRGPSSSCLSPAGGGAPACRLRSGAARPRTATSAAP